MRSLALILLLTYSIHAKVCAQTSLATGEQPQMSLDAKGIIRLVYGGKDKIFFTESKNNGSTFSKPVLVAEIPGMHLGMTRGPQIATSKDYSLVTAMDKEGNIHSLVLNHKTGKWGKSGRVNDKDGSAPEGLMSIAADESNRFYAVWLDLRDDRKNNICFASFEKNKWSANKFAYLSAEDHVCECCKPSITAKGQTVSVMFRNWLKGSRDLYLTTSTDGGKTFSKAQKLGNGTWQLKGCPMDGGGVAIDSKNQTHTAWQREGIVYYAQPGQPEQKIGDGRHVALHGNLISWENGSDLIVKGIDGSSQKIGEGTAMEVLQLKDKSILAIWETNDQIVFKKIKG
ncbi:MAG TPA: hypothetical protein VGD40_16435 [Chryseosolibacter sp.]